MVLDARFISGSDGDAIGTWSSRTSSTYNMTQATTANKPLLKLGSNGLNGQATVLFDGTNDYMDGANESIDTCSFFCAVNNTNSLTYKNIFGRSSQTYIRNIIVLTETASNKLVVNRSDGSTSKTAATTDFTAGARIVNAYYDGTNLGIRIDGKSYSTQTGVSSTGGRSWNLGYLYDGPSASYYWDSKMSSVILFKNSVASSSMAKRVEHSLGYSFKIACS